jgi:ribosomal protein L34
MNIEEARYEGNSKFMWDGEVYDASADAEQKKKSYEDSGFEARMFEQEGKYLLYSRREVKEIVLDGAPPA